MSSQLEQLLGYLEREGVTEVLFGSGRPIAMRKGGALTNITARPLSADQLSNMLRGSEISALVPETDGEGTTAQITVGKRKAMAQVARKGHEIVVSLKRAPGNVTAAGTLPLARVAVPAGAPLAAAAPSRSRPPTASRAKSPTSTRAKSATTQPRTKPPTRAKTASGTRSKTGPVPRLKGSTTAPRTKSPTAAQRSRSSTAAPHTKPATSPPRKTGSVPALKRGPDAAPQEIPLVLDRTAQVTAIDPSGPSSTFDFALDDGIAVAAPAVSRTTSSRAARHDDTVSLGALDGDSFELDLEPPQSFDVDFNTSPPQPHGRRPAPSSPPGSVDIDFSTNRPQPLGAPSAQGFARPTQESFAKPTTSEFAKPRNEEFAKPKANDGFLRINTGGFAKPQPVEPAPSKPKRPPSVEPLKHTAKPPSVDIGKRSDHDPFGKTAPFASLPDLDSAPGADLFGTSAKSVPYGQADKTLGRAETAQMDVPEIDESSPLEIAHAGTAPIQVMRGQLPPTAGARLHNPAFAALVGAAREMGASDLHIAAARVTSVRVHGELVPVEEHSNPLSAQGAEELLLPLLEARDQATLDKVGYVDFALEAPGGGRLRANISRQQQGLKGTFRLAVAAPATLEQLGLPVELAKVVSHHQGLVVIAGPSGHGKTTTLAALVDLINSTKPYHILTIEDPVEIVHSRKQAVISQREAGRHTQSFARGLKASLREDPDVIVIGELRDRESVEIALTAAETGHLVIATMSTPSAAKTIDRLIDMFPPEEHSQVRASVAGALRAIVAQRLLPKKGGGIVPAVELVTGVLPLAVLIREDKLYQLPNLMQRGRAFGMIRFDESLAEHVRAGRLDEATALSVAESKKDLSAALKPQVGAVPAATKTSPLWGFGKKENR